MSRRLIVVLIAAIGIAPAACSRDPQKLKLEFVANGDRYMKEAKYAEAVIEYRNAVNQDSLFGEAHYKLGNAYLLTSDPRAALGEFVRAADLMPTNVDAQLQAGKLLLLASQYPEAKARAAAALEREAKNPDALRLMGNAMAGMKDLDAAITQIEDAIATDPRRTLNYANLGSLELSRGNAPAAESAFKRAIEVEPKSVDAHLSLANYYWATRQVADAEREFKLVLELDPKSVSANRALATFYLTSDRAGEAEPYLKAYATIAGDTGSKLVLADYYLSANKGQDATAILQQLLEAKDGFIPAKLRFAAIDFAANRKPQAYAAVDEALKRDAKSEDALLVKGRFKLADNDAAEALRLADRVVLANAGSIGGNYLRGLALQASGDPDEAINAFKQVLQLSPSAVPAQIALATLLLNRGDAAAAIEFIGQAIKLDPQSGAGHYLLAKAQLQLGNAARAEAEVLAVVASNPTSADVQTLLGDLRFAKREFSQAREAYSRALQLTPGHIDALAGLTKVDLAEKKPDAARARLDAALTATPNSTSLLLLAGATAMATGDQPRAESVFKHVLELDPKSLPAYASLGRIYMSQNRLDEALKSFQDTAQRQPKAAVGALTMVGTILGLQGKIAEANKSYEQALGLDAKAAVAANNLAWSLAESAESDATLDRALQLAQVAKSQLPKSWEVNDTLGWVYYKKGLASLAITSFREGVAQNASDPILHYHLGLAYLKGGNKTEARKSLSQALKLNPKFQGAEDASRQLADMGK